MEANMECAAEVVAYKARGGVSAGLVVGVGRRGRLGKEEEPTPRSPARRAQECGSVGGASRREGDVEAVPQTQLRMDKTAHVRSVTAASEHFGLPSPVYGLNQVRQCKVGPGG